MRKESYSASSGYAAAAIQRLIGKIPPFKPRKDKEGEAGQRISAAKEAAALLVEKKFPLSQVKKSISEKYKIPYLKNSEILRFVPRSQTALRSLLLKSPSRTLSGVSPIAIMPPPASCGGNCIYCPRGENAPQSYTGFEPTTMRAIQNDYSASRQVLARIRQYNQQGHPTDKCHLIIMGGTFLCVGKRKRHLFMKEAFEALNGKKAHSLRQAIDENEHAPHRAVGVTFETRPDFAFEPHADEMLQMGGTQVELGVQSLSDIVYRKVNRGHTIGDVVRATAVLKDSGFKVLYHMMPGLFSTPKQDISYFRRLFSSPDFRPDMLKIYPALVVAGTGLYQLWKAGKFCPYGTEEAAEVIAKATEYIPPYVRIMRVQRDIPSPLVCAGVKNSNLQQIVEKKLSERGKRCRCIRCREIGSTARKGAPVRQLNLSLQRIDYQASKGKEVFLSFEDVEKGLLAAFLRLRIPHKSHRKEIRGISSIVRELHVYGQEAEIGQRSEAKFQHKGLGRRLMEEAEKITKEEFGLEKICVISGPGARGYYRKLGYSLNGPYMAKRI
ncbi:MAG: tRNA uridine(34) 5-carboxymethylaminomethyl modification radical SAM/GNAT enzyme Elp3 [Candidatus Micrarchaeota archaeon]|nr:tRNA uridine(34) 5-carboxymethylaminomethyl modification radical SAM/GNAT enzyme Elp3 [Candidatus Micrarchaeota archaeon]